MPTILDKAKKNKADEFYTQLPDIEAEMRHYQEQFRGKVIGLLVGHSSHLSALQRALPFGCETYDERTRSRGIEQSRSVYAA